MANTPRYREIADDLRTRLGPHEFPLGSVLPGISDLQAHYGVDGLNTIRRAQAILIEEGLLDPRQGHGTFVIALPGTATEERQALRADLLALADSLAKTRGTVVRLLRHLDDAEPTAD